MGACDVSSRPATSRFARQAALPVPQCVRQARLLVPRWLNLDTKVHISIIVIDGSRSMKITAQEEYGLRCLLRLARAVDGSLTLQEIADAEGLSLPHVAKLMSVM